MGALATDPREVDAKNQKRWRGVQAMATETKVYRLYHNDDPVGATIEAFPMEAAAWNKNAAAFYAHQMTLGRDRLPLLEFREEKGAQSVTWRVEVTENQKKRTIVVVAPSKAQARREAENLVSIAGKIGEPERAEDIELKIKEGRDVERYGEQAK